jgi:hypothetical protein
MTSRAKKTGTSLIPCPSLDLRLSPLHQPPSFEIPELDSKHRGVCVSAGVRPVYIF